MQSLHLLPGCASRLASLTWPLRAAAPVAMEVDDGDFQDAEDTKDGINPEKMTVAQLKSWLTDNGHDDRAYELASSKAKKADFVAAVKNVLGVA